MHRPQLQTVHQFTRQTGVKGQAIFVFRIGAPLRQTTPHRVRADHAPAACAQVRGQLVHVTARSGQTMPGHHRAFFGLAPVGVMDFDSGTCHVVGRETHAASSLPVCWDGFFKAARVRKRPTTPVGK